MKKVVFISLLFLAAFSGYSQFAGSPSPIGNANNIVIPQGGIAPILYLGVPSFVDTSSANNGKTNMYNNSLIRTSSDKKIWIRDFGLAKWVDITSGISALQTFQQTINAGNIITKKDTIVGGGNPFGFLNSPVSFGSRAATKRDQISVQDLDPALGFYQNLTNQKWQIRVGRNTGGASTEFNVYDSTGDKLLFSANTSGQITLGNAPVGALANESKVLIYGGTNGANLDIIGDSLVRDQAIVELEGADYKVSPNSAALEYYGKYGIGTTLGFSNQKLGVLRFKGNLYSIINSEENIPLRFATNNTERLQITGAGNIKFIKQPNLVTSTNNILVIQPDSTIAQQNIDLVYQPLEDQRLSTTDDVNFNSANIANNLVISGTTTAGLINASQNIKTNTDLISLQDTYVADSLHIGASGQRGTVEWFSATPNARMLAYYIGTSIANVRFRKVNTTDTVAYLSDVRAAAGGGSGTVSTVTVTPANGFAGTVANATTTPAITLSTSVTGLLKGDGTAISAVTSGTDIKTVDGQSIIGSGNLVTANSKLPYRGLVGGGTSNIDPTTGASTFTSTLFIGLGNNTNDRLEFAIGGGLYYNYGDSPAFTLNKTTGLFTLLNSNIFIANQQFTTDLNQ